MEVPEQKFLDAEAQAMVIAEVANVLQAQNLAANEEHDEHV